MFLIGIVVGITVLVGGEIIGVFALEPKIHPKQKQIDKRYNVKIVRFLLFIIFMRLFELKNQLSFSGFCLIFP